MTTGPYEVPFLAVIEPMAAGWLLARNETEMRKQASVLVAYRGTQAAELGRQLQRAAARLDASRRWQADQTHAHTAPVVDDDPAWLSTAEAATELGVGSRQVLNYIDGGNGPLPATRKGPRSPWRIRAGDLADFRDRLSEVAS